MSFVANHLGFGANRRHKPIYIDVLSPQAYYTSGDRVKANIRVGPASRPTRINVSLRTLTIIHHTDAKPVLIDLLRESQDLFVSFDSGEAFDRLRTGATSEGYVELPFSFTFPQSVMIPPPGDRHWFYSKDSYNHPRFQHHPGFPLPPSCVGNTSLSPSIIHQLEACIESPDKKPLRVCQELKYLPPAPDFHLALLQPDLNFGSKLPKHCSRQKFIRTRKLLPQYDQNGKLGRFKDKLRDKELLLGFQSFTEIPYAKFNLFATPASVLVIGSLVPAIITLQHLQRSESVVLPPDIFLHRIKVQLSWAINTFVPSLAKYQGVKEVMYTEKDQIILYDGKFEKDDQVALYNGLNVLDLANIWLVNEKIVPSFTSYGLNREYELHIEIWGGCVDREFQGIACTQPVQVVTELHAPISLRSADGSDMLEADPRPEYQELDPMAQTYDVDSEREMQELEAQALRNEFDSRHNAPSASDRVPPPEYGPPPEYRP
jgi:hypothetical protein